MSYHDQKGLDKLRDRGIEIHPRGVKIHVDAKVETGAQIDRDCVIEERASIGRCAILRRGVTIGADATVEPYAVLETGVAVNTGARIGRSSTIGRKTVVEHHASVHANIGESARIESRAEVGLEIPNLSHGRTTVGCHARIGALTLIGNTVRIGEKADIGPGCVIGTRTEIGASARIAPLTTIGERVTICADIECGSLDDNRLRHLEEAFPGTRGTTIAADTMSATRMTGSHSYRPNPKTAMGTSDREGNAEDAVRDAINTINDTERRALHDKGVEIAASAVISEDVALNLPAGTVIGAFAVIGPKVSMGRGVKVDAAAVVMPGAVLGETHIGEGAVVGDECLILGTEIEPDARVGMRCVIGGDYGLTDLEAACRAAAEDDPVGPTKIGRGARIGPATTIRPNVTVGENAVVGQRCKLEDHTTIAPGAWLGSATETAPGTVVDAGRNVPAGHDVTTTDGVYNESPNSLRTAVWARTPKETATENQHV